MVQKRESTATAGFRKWKYTRISPIFMKILYSFVYSQGKYWEFNLILLIKTNYSSIK